MGAVSFGQLPPEYPPKFGSVFGRPLAATVTKKMRTAMDESPG